MAKATKTVVEIGALAEVPVTVPEVPAVIAAKYAVTPADLLAGRNRVLVAGRGSGKVEQHVNVGPDPYGGIKVSFDNGVTCAFENDPAVVQITGKALVAITPWDQMSGSGEWVSLYEGKGGLAARVYPDGTWNVYSSRGDWSEGKGSSVDEAKKLAIVALTPYGADVSVLLG